MYDRDKAGCIALAKLRDSNFFKESKNNKAIYVPPSECIKNLFSRGLIIPYEIEHLLSCKCWELIKSSGFAVERSSSELNEILADHADKNRSATEIFEMMVPEQEIRETILYYEPDKDSKIQIFNLINNAPEDDKKEYMSGFSSLIVEIEKRFASNE